MSSLFEALTGWRWLEPLWFFAALPFAYAGWITCRRQKPAIPFAAACFLGGTAPPTPQPEPAPVAPAFARTTKLYEASGHADRVQTSAPAK